MDVGNILVHGSLKQTANTAIQIAVGTTANRPANQAGLVRYNSDLSRYETNNGTAWSNIGAGDGTVTSISLTGVANAITVSGSPITGAGTLTLALAGELAGLSAISTNGLVARTAAGTYTPRTMAASAVAGAQGITITNGDGVAGAPVIGFTITGLTAEAGAIAGTNTLAMNDGTNNLKATFTQVATFMDTLFVNQGGDTMTGALVLAADPASALQAATKSYVDNAAVTATTNAQSNSVLKAGSTMTGLLVLSADPTAPLGASTKSYVDNSIATAISTDTYTASAAGGLLLTGKAFSANTTSASTGLVGGNIAVRSTALTGQVLRSTGTAGAEATWGALDLTNANAVTGALAVANGGTGGATAAIARTNLVVPSIFRASFTNATLVSNALTVTHNLSQQFVHVTVTDNNNKIIQPDDITMTSTSASTVDLTSYGALTGTWNVTVIG
jgi:hypothetical protein